MIGVTLSSGRQCHGKKIHFFLRPSSHLVPLWPHRGGGLEEEEEGYNVV